MVIGAVAQTVTLSLVNNQQYPGGNATNFYVLSNVVAQVIYAYLPTYNGISLLVSLNGVPGAYYGMTSSGPIADLPTVVGPATITLSYTNSSIKNAEPGVSFCTIQTTTSTSFTPSTAVVIPNDGAGPVTIILESSVDLVNWTSALPGTYGTTTSNRFFRVRAQR